MIYSVESIKCPVGFRPVFLDWIFIVLVAPFFLAGITMTICILSAGRYLFCRRCYSLALVIARIECLFVPFVTILGVFTFIALSRESVKALFPALATIPTARRTARRRNNTIAVQQISEERSDLLPSSATVKFCQRDPAADIY